MTAWMALNAATSAMVALLLTYILARWHERFSTIERVGMGLIGAGCLLTMGPILWPYQTPYQDWSASLYRIGCVVFFVGHAVVRHARSAQ